MEENMTRGGARKDAGRKRSPTSARLPAFVEPRKPKLVFSVRPGDLIYGIKFDGCRALALRGGSETRVLSRNEKDLGGKIPRSKKLNRRARCSGWDHCLCRC